MGQNRMPMEDQNPMSLDRSRRSPFPSRHRLDIRGVVWCQFKSIIPDREYSTLFQAEFWYKFPNGNITLDRPHHSMKYSRTGIMREVSMKTVIMFTADIGAAIRKKRKGDGLTLVDAAGLCNVNYRFLSDLENGKETVQLGKVLQVLHCLGIEIHLTDRIRTNA